MRGGYNRRLAMQRLYGGASTGVGGSVPVAAGGPTINVTDFSTNFTTAKSGYSAGATFTNGSTTYDFTAAYHTTNLGSTTQAVQAQIHVDASDWANGGPVMRCNGNGTSSTGYIVEIQGATTMVISPFTGGTWDGTGGAVLTFAAGSFAMNGTYYVRVTVNSSNQFNAWKWGGASWVAATSTNVVPDTVYSGTYVGAGTSVNATGSNTCWMDNFQADTDVGNLVDP